MDGKMITSNQSHRAEPSFDAIRVMVVDDDIICLSIVAGMLKTWKYQDHKTRLHNEGGFIYKKWNISPSVVTVKNAEDALITLRTRSNFFHLVVTDVHMPKMDGFEFQKQVREEFKLPVVMMSADDKESSILRGLEAGAVFYIVKPVNYDDLKDLWQYALSPRKGKSVVIREIQSAQGASLVEKTPNVGAGTTSMRHEEKQNKRDSKKKTEKKVNEDNEQENSEAVVPRKSKVVWTTALHNEFLDAIRKIGLERAVPKRILEHMNEPGLTRENVASHLQKYRIFLKRIMEASSYEGSSVGKYAIERALRSSFATGHPSLVINTIQQGMLGNIQRTPSLSVTIFSDQPASSSNPIPELGYGQSHSVDNSAYLPQPTFGNTKALYQANGGMNSTNPKQMYEQETQARSELVPDVMYKNNFPACGVLDSNDIHDIQNTESFNTSSLTPNFNCNYSIADQMGFSGAEVSNGFNGNSDLIHGNTGNMNSGYYYPGAYSPAGFGRTNQPSARFSNVNQQENNPMLLSQQNNLGNGGDKSYLFDHLTNNTAPGENVFPPQFAQSDLDENFLNQQKNPSYNGQQAGEEVWNRGHVINSYPVEQNPLENQQYSNQRESNGGIWGYNFGNGTHQLDDYYPIFDPYPNQQQGDGGFQDPGSNNGYPNVTPSWNQGVNDGIDSMFGPGRY